MRAMQKLGPVRRRAGLLVLGLVGAVGPASAAIEEVIVSTRRVEESLQSVPVAVTAFTSQEIEQIGLRDLQDVSQFTPGLTYQNINGTLQLPVIRGLAQTNITGAENNVANFLNGIYLSNNRALDVALIDLERVEVIKGPQSALYGRNSFAGAISYVTAKPSDEFEAYVQGSLGGDELYDAKLSVSGPLIEDRLKGRVAVMTAGFDGTFTNQASSDNLQGYDGVGAYGALEWRITDAIGADLFVYWADQDNEHPAQVFIPNNCGVSAFSTPTYLCGTVPVPSTFRISPDAYGLESQNAVVGLTLSWAISDAWTLKSLTGFSDSESNSLLDNDGTATGVPFPISGGGTVVTNAYLGQGRTEVQDFSQEFRVVYDAGGRWSGSAGLYYFDSDRSDQSFGGVDSSVLGVGQSFAGLGAIFATPDPVGQPVDSNDNDESIRDTSAFGQVGFQVTERIDLSLEGRYTAEKKEIERFLLFGGPPPPSIPRQQEDTFRFFTYRAIANFQATDDQLYYLSVASGARSGGFNARATLPEEATYDEETNTTYELGAKTQWLDGRLQANAALFLIDWEDLQIASRSQDPANIFAVTRNTGSATSKGFELALQAQVTDGLQVGVGYAYVNPEFDSGAVDLGLAAICGTDNSICRRNAAGQPLVSGNQLGRTHENQFNANVAYTGDFVGAWNWYARADFAWLDEQPVRSDNVQFIDSYSVTNARIGFTSERYEIALWSKNLFDEDYLTAVSQQPRFDGRNITDTTLGLGRTWGITGRVNFGR